MVMRKCFLFRFIVFIGFLSNCSFISHVFAADKKAGAGIYEDRQMLVKASTRRPEQLDAFYTGRGFSRDAIDRIINTCFVTVLIKNKTYDALWLILDDWTFVDRHGKRIERITRPDWKNTWQSIGLKQAHQSTFGWTQLPESRDLRVDEHVAGNVAVPWQTQAFKLVASFKTGRDKSGEPRTIVLENLRCTK